MVVFQIVCLKSVDFTVMLQSYCFILNNLMF